MKNINFIAVLILFYLTTGVSAQESTDLDELDLVNRQVIDIGVQQNTSNAAFVQQLGNQNTSRIIQEYGGGELNVDVISQSGDRNYGFLQQSGSGLNTVIGQNGDDNSASLWAIGNNIRTDVRQNGSNNIINSYIENFTPKSRGADLRQDGDNNRIELSLRGEGFSVSEHLSQQVKITQTGNSHEAVANMDPFSAPFEITQTPGIGGEGMKVNVSTSQFNFPMRR